MARKKDTPRNRPMVAHSVARDTADTIKERAQSMGVSASTVVDTALRLAFGLPISEHQTIVPRLKCG